MYKWILLCFCCSTLCAAELKFELDQTWTPVEQQEDVSLEFREEYTRTSDAGVERISLMIGPRYSIDGESLSKIQPQVPFDSILMTAKMFGQSEGCDFVSIHSVDDNSALLEICIENPESEEEEALSNTLGAVKIFLSETRLAVVSYQFVGEDFSKCDMGYWIQYLDQNARFIDREKRPQLRYNLNLKPSLWKQEVDPAAMVAETWIGPHGEQLRAVVAPRNVLNNMTLDEYIAHQYTSDAYVEVLTEDKKTGWIISEFRDSQVGIQIEKVTFADNYIASITISGGNKTSLAVCKEWIAIINQAKLVKNRTR